MQTAYAFCTILASTPLIAHFYCMKVDNTTLADLGVLGHDDQSIVSLLNYCTTSSGAAYLQNLLLQPLATAEEITERQQTIQAMGKLLPGRPQQITNGTFMVVNKFYDTPINHIDDNASFLGSLLYKLLYTTDYSHVRYTIQHLHHLVAGMQSLVEALRSQQNLPATLRKLIDRIEQHIHHKAALALGSEPRPKNPGVQKVMRYGWYFKYHFKQNAEALEQVYSEIDAYFGLAMAIEKLGWHFPKVLPQTAPHLTAKSLHHPLVPQAVSYDVDFAPEQNFLFLTGANMAGKSTFIKALGLAAYLAHVGMAVPAKEFSISLLQGLLSNIHVTDNVARGESYFFNEVQRIKKTLLLLQDGRNWLVLIDELFKGTNVQDAMLCSSTVIEGLRLMPNALFVVSTHLYEIGEPLRRHSNIQFRYFETSVHDEQLEFSYQLKEGISQDRLGYLILKREGVVKLLQQQMGSGV